MKRLRILFIWTLVSLPLQLGAYSLLNYQIEKIMMPIAVSNEPITSQLKTTIPGSDLRNIQISFAKDYLAYSENGTLKVFNLKNGKVVFKSPAANDETLGILTYQWLSDRDTLLYFYADKKSKTGNQTTKLYSLELPSSDDDTAPDNLLKKTIEFPAGGKIEELVVSPSTNLMYFTVKKGLTEQLMEVDIMKDVRTLTKQGETVDAMASSDQHGTLYIDSKVGSTQTIIAFDAAGKRKLISRNNYDKILGVRSGKVYIGEVKNNELIKIKSITDRSNMTDSPSLKTEWNGSIPFNNATALVGTKGQIVVYDNQTAYIVTNGQLKEVKLLGDQNYVSDDGTELIQLSKQGTSTLVELQPLKP